MVRHSGEEWLYGERGLPLQKGVLAVLRGGLGFFKQGVWLAGPWKSQQYVLVVRCSQGPPYRLGGWPALDQR